MTELLVGVLGEKESTQKILSTSCKVVEQSEEFPT